MIHTGHTSLPFSGSWRALQIFSWYRVILALYLIIMSKLGLDTSFLNVRNPELYSITANAYALLALISITLSFFYKKLYYLQLAGQVLLDIVLIIIIIHASGSAINGLGVLIAVSVSASTILSGSPAALIFSVLASLAVLGEELYSTALYEQQSSNMTYVGILSITYMATSLMSYYISKKLIESELVAEESIKGLENMEKLNEEIIQFMSTGVMVVDGNNFIRLINRSAWLHLGMPESTRTRRLEEVSSPLARQLNLWRMKHNYHAKPFKNMITGPELSPNFSPIGGSKSNALIFLENTTILTQQAQSLKLASLGRLTASIAHEIRNPLSSLSHAAQLMNESENENSPNAKLIEIINKNTKRVNGIIENIMQLSQTKQLQVKELNLSEYLPNMLQEYLGSKESPPQIEFQPLPSELIIYFDPLQLSQILTNLFDNAARYSEINTGSPVVKLVVGVEPHSNTAFLDVIDNGDGIAPDIAEKIFEPFFTTSRGGTGLGLYLSKELCEMNRARLNYIPLTTGGSCFRISFSLVNLTRNKIKA